MLETLEEEIIEYEKQTGRRPMADRPRQESFSGYTLAIVDSVTKLTRYLKEVMEKNSQYSRSADI